MAEPQDAGTVALAWAHALVDGLVDAGLETVVVAPGSRSTPLVLAAADHAGIETVSHLDERSGAFYALGQARARGRPTAIITTSGTATANVLPAVIEAHESRVPLLVLTGDRPPELLDSGANQTIRQSGIYGEFTRYERTLGEPSVDAHRLRSVRATAARAMAEATGPPAGAVHLNVPVRKPLEPPTPAARDRAVDLASGTTPTVTPASTAPPSAAIAAVADRLGDAQRPLVVVGPAGLTGAHADALIELAGAVDAPVAADPASGLRFMADDVLIVGGYDAYLPAIETVHTRPDMVIRVGPQPTSKSLRDYLDTPDAHQVLLDPMPAWRDRDFRLDTLCRGDVADTATALADAADVADDRPYTAAFAAAEAAYWSAIEATLGETLAEATIANQVAALAPTHGLLFAGNSMPIRDLDRFGRPRSDGPPVVANRGVSGIDGTVSTALGAGAASERPVVALLGDLATYHDMNGLLAIERFGLDATIVVVNNDGGGIFQQLPIEAHDPPFERLFETPHGLDFAAAADQYGLDYSAVETVADLTAALSSDIDGGHLIECHVDRHESAQHRERVTEAALTAVEEELA